MSGPGDHLVRLRGLHIATSARDLVRGVDLDVYAGRVTAVMGPSGSGKTLTANAVMGLIEVEPGLQAGELRYPALAEPGLAQRDWFEGVRGGGQRAQRRLLEQTRALRGSFMTYSPQTASSALNPGRTIGRQLELAIRRRARGATLGPEELAREVRRSLDEVGLPPSAAGALPGELSGGQCQRAALAFAVAPQPRLVIADEPETGLDPVLTRAVIELMIAVCRDHGCGLLLISHHDETVQRIAHEVVRLGRVEGGT